MTQLDFGKEIIFLQLKKPKKWNWEISTSKSSPHIALPTIQLYNSKGQLLVETSDHGTMQKQSWNSLQRGNMDARPDCRNSQYLRRSRSDNLESKLTRYRASTLPSREASTEPALERDIHQYGKNHTAALPSLIDKRRNRSSEHVMANIRKTSEPRIEQTHVETNDHETTQNQSWNPLQRGTRDCRNSQYLRRSRSDNLENKLMRYRASKLPSCGVSTEPTVQRGEHQYGKQTSALPSLIDKRRNRSSGHVMGNIRKTSEPPEINGYGTMRKESLNSLPKGNRDIARPVWRNSPYLQRSRSDNLESKLMRYRASTLPSCEPTNEPFIEKVGHQYGVLMGKPGNRSSEPVMANIPKTYEPKIEQTLVKKSSCLEKKSVQPYHCRSKSDDLFQKTRKKYNMAESKKRAEHDGYMNFINEFPHHEGDSQPECKRKEERSKKGALVESSAVKTVMINNVPVPVEVKHLPQPKRYRLRQSRAGILVISDESFSSSHRRRCHGDLGDCSQDNNDVIIEGDLESLNFSKSSGNVFGDLRGRGKTNNLAHSKSDSFTFKKFLHFAPDAITYDKKNSVGIDNNNNNCNYVGYNHPFANSNNNGTVNLWKEANMPMDYNSRFTSLHSNESGKVSGLHLGNKKLPKNGLLGRLSFRIEEDPILQKPKFQTLQSIERTSSKESNGEDVSSNPKEKINNCDVSGVMGANVSRHSTKGLSGRRSQSSGSICNGKERCQGDGSGKGSGGSLPSYLDDRGSTSTNNYEDDAEGAPVDEDERIPPLGDGALLHWKFSDTQTAQCQDQGYGSERSPEEEYPPVLPEHDLDQCHHHLEPHSCYPFITPESTFSVKLCKGSRGLGLSVTGGVESGGSWPGLVRIKRLFPHQPASACGLLNVGDLLLEVNGVPLTGLTNYEALEVLRTATNQVELKVSRPPPDVLNCVSPISEIPPPPPTRRDPPSSLDVSSNFYSTTPDDEYYHGEFEVILTKIQGSLGFTLRKEDESALGHYVRALVREPALTDGRIKAGDRIIAVNDVEIFPMTHEQAVQYLRQCGDKVKLRLYRDSPQTPLATLSPSETTPRTSFSRKANLRQEAVDMLNDIALRKLVPRHPHQLTRRSQSPTSSPRRLRRHNYPSTASHRESDIKYLIPEEQFHEGMLKCKHFDEDSFNSLFTIESEDGDRPLRPNSLDLYNPNQTPVAARKPRFNFSLAHNAYELNNLDPEVLDAPNLTYNLGNEEGDLPMGDCGDSFPKEPASMPHIPLDNSSMAFRYRNPAYQSAHPPCVENDPVSRASTSSHHTHKEEEETDTIKRKKGILKKDSKKHLNKSETKTETEVAKLTHMKEEFEILAIELNRGWNSRLGFSLQGAAGVTYVSAVYANSVAARDGRIKPGDRIVKVNDEDVDHMSTSEIIDLLRIVRGPVCIFVKRIKSNEDCTKSNAEN